MWIDQILLQSYRFPITRFFIHLFHRINLNPFELTPLSLLPNDKSTSADDGIFWTFQAWFFFLQCWLICCSRIMLRSWEWYRIWEKKLRRKGRGRFGWGNINVTSLRVGRTGESPRFESHIGASVKKTPLRLYGSDPITIAAVSPRGIRSAGSNDRDEDTPTSIWAPPLTWTSSASDS